MSMDRADEVLEDLVQLRSTVREQRHAFWLPLLIFGLLVCAAAPLYAVVGPINSICVESCSTGILGDTRLPWLYAMGGGVLGLYWVFALAAGAVSTAVWFRWYGLMAGVRSRAADSVLVWLLGVALLLTLPTIALGVGYQLRSMTERHLAAPLILGVGLLALAWMERSRLLLTVVSLYTAWMLWAVFLGGAQSLMREASAWGVNVPLRWPTSGSAFDLAVAGVILLVGAAVAIAEDFRRR